MQGQMKVLVIHCRYRQPAGEAAAVRAHIDLLRQHGHEVILYTRDNREIDQSGIGRKAVIGLETVCSKRTVREIEALVERERPDVAHVHNVFPLISPSAYTAPARAGVPVIQTVHNFRFLCPNGLFYTHGRICERCKHGNVLHAMRWRCYRNSSTLSALYALTIGLHRWLGTFRTIERFIALTPFTAQKLVEGGIATEDRIRVLGHFLPSPLPEPGSPARPAPRIVFLGRLACEKGVDVLVDAMSDLPDVALTVLGDGPLEQSLQATCRDTGLRNVEFLGYVGGEEKWRHLRGAAASVVPSVWYETFCLAAVESLAMGTPVVASNLGSLPYVVEDGKSGLLFEPGDSLDLRRKLRWLLENPGQAAAMGRFGRQTVETRYSAEAHYRGLMALYSEVVG